jgi:hypothetical protein
MEIEQNLEQHNTDINEVKVPQSQNDAKVLGVSWDCAEDVLKYKLKL